MASVALGDIQVPRLPRKTKVDVTKCHACHVKRRWMSPNATPATQSAAPSPAPKRAQARHQVQQAPHLPRETKVDVAKCHACHAKRRWMSPSATPACYVKRRWMSPGATPAPQSTAASQAIKRAQARHQSQPSAISATRATQTKCGDIHLRFTWQVWHLVTSTFALHGRRGACGAGLALVSHTIFVTHHLLHIALSHTIFHTPSLTHPLPHYLSHTIFDTPSFTHHLSHPTLSHTMFVTHHLSHTTLSPTIFDTHTHIHTTLSHTIFDTHLCHTHTQSFTHHFVTHHLSHTIFHIPFLTHHFVTHHLSPTIFHTPLCHPPSFTHHFVSHHLSPHHPSRTTSSHTIFHTHNFVTRSLSHTNCHTLSFAHNFHTHHLLHTTLSHVQKHSSLHLEKVSSPCPVLDEKSEKWIPLVTTKK